MKVAVVGSGVAGLAATWTLNEHSPHTVHLFEADSRPGGHANTVDFTRPGPPPPPDEAEAATSTRVDTGFIVFNTVTYPNYLRFVELLELPYLASEMSFSVSRDRGQYEWAGTSISALFAQRRNLFNPAQWRMVWDILRFNSEVLEVIRHDETGESIGSYLERNGYSDSFRDNYLLPMTAAIWSTPPDTAALDFPITTLIRFMHNHHLLQILNRPTWLTLPQGSHSYVSRVVSRLPVERYHLSTPIESASSTTDGKVVLRTASGREEIFDHVVFACHADTTLRILERGEGITPQEKAVLGEFEFSQNRAVLHSDPALMPNRRSTWSAWNYLTSSDGLKSNLNVVSLTYWMNLLQSIPENIHGPVLVTLNPPFEPQPELVAGAWSYSHPLFSEKSVKAQNLLPTIQNKRGMTFCGAWTKYGFHEDGFKSGLHVASTYLSSPLPFPVQDAERAVPFPLTDHFLVAFFALAEGLRRAVQPLWKVVMLLSAAALAYLLDGVRLSMHHRVVTWAVSETKLEALRQDAMFVKRCFEESAGVTRARDKGGKKME